MDWLDVLLALIGAPLLIWCFVLLVELGAAAKALRRRRTGSADTPEPVAVSYTVLIPAHNESADIAKTICELQQVMTGDGDMLVIADNCDDETAERARQCGAKVVERSASAQRGKGYALSFGLAALEKSPPDVVVILDADCEFTRGNPAGLAAVAQMLQRPVQSHYAMRLRDGEGLPQRIAHFAWRMKNGLRPTGLGELHLPCQLAGTGMAFPWHQIRAARLATANIVEDLALGIELASRGDPPFYCSSVQVTSTFPLAANAARGQRERWEHGHLHTILTAGPAMIIDALRRRDYRLLAMAMDMSVPPLSLLALAIGAYVVLSLGLSLIDPLPISLILSCVIFSIFASVITVAWALSARDLLGPRDLVRVALHVIAKVNIYVRFTTQRQREWIRTARK
ncbi:glycosyltransferase family 2 protein [Microbulbifer magnicolonia]|uniref:glycosyltransferase family 2 protein n=1 Tax=Microbulbifer magnicolonia TaxID=3109744 RepID=UPI002B4048B2|nr:glycosyltransferase family 2 protein [Microbulbifer sp. GG15]